MELLIDFVVNCSARIPLPGLVVDLVFD